MDFKDSCKLKILVIGHKGSGKTNIMLKYTENKFENTNIVSRGFNFRNKPITIGTNRILIQIWDLAITGQTSINMGPIYRGANAIIIVFDLSNRESFERVSKLIKNVKSNVLSSMILFLVGNKSDLTPEVSTDEAYCKALENKLYYADVSAKTGDQLEMVFGIIANTFLENDVLKNN